MLKTRTVWAVVEIHRDGTEIIADDGEFDAEWDARRPAQDCIERKREDMRECRKMKRRGKIAESGYEHIRGYRIARIEKREAPRTRKRALTNVEALQAHNEGKHVHRVDKGKVLGIGYACAYKDGWRIGKGPKCKCPIS